jgi:hypothetical protein
MSCTTYIHNDPAGGSKYISGTTCFGQVVYYTLTYGQSVCMDDSLPLINCDGLDIDGDCFPTTPTPTPTSPLYCYQPQLSTENVSWICPNTGEIYYEIIKKIRIDIFSQYGVPSFSHPRYQFTLFNGTDTEYLVVESNQSSAEFIWISRDYNFNGSSCVATNYPDWAIVSAPEIYLCIPPTPSPTASINCDFAGFAQYVPPTPTPTQTPTPTPVYYYYEIGRAPLPNVGSDICNSMWTGVYTRTVEPLTVTKFYCDSNGYRIRCNVAVDVGSYAITYIASGPTDRCDELTC